MKKTEELTSTSQQTHFTMKFDFLDSSRLGIPKKVRYQYLRRGPTQKPHGSTRNVKIMIHIDIFCQS